MKAEKIFENYAQKIVFFLNFEQKLLKQANGTLATEFYKAQSNSEKNLIVFIMHAYSHRGNNNLNLKQH